MWACGLPRRRARAAHLRGCCRLPPDAFLEHAAVVDRTTSTARHATASLEVAAGLSLRVPTGRAYGACGPVRARGAGLQASRRRFSGGAGHQRTDGGGVKQQPLPDTAWELTPLLPDTGDGAPVEAKLRTGPSPEAVQGELGRALSPGPPEQRRLLLVSSARKRRQPAAPPRRGKPLLASRRTQTTSPASIKSIIYTRNTATRRIKCVLDSAHTWICCCSDLMYWMVWSRVETWLL
nr:uncharacterized protein LOC117847788 [Setaria viridis]